MVNEWNKLMAIKIAYFPRFLSCFSCSQWMSLMAEFIMNLAMGQVIGYPDKWMVTLW